MRLAFVTTNRNYPWGGAEIFWHALALRARGLGWPVFAVVGPFTVDSAPVQELRLAGVEIGVLPPSDSVHGGRLAFVHRFQRRALGVFQGVGARLRKFKPDLLFVNQCGAFDGASELWLQGAIASSGIPYSTLSHNNDGTPLNLSLQRQCRHWLTGAVSAYFVSEENLILSEKLLGTRLTNVSIVQNPLPLPSEPTPWPSSPPYRIGVLGRWEIHEKGLDLIISSAQRVLGNQTGWEITFFGRGPDEEALRALIDQAGLSGRIHLAGFTPNPIDIWKTHHLCLLASRWEGFSYVMAEALASGRPVLRTRNGGASWVEHGTTGWLCTPDSPDALAQTLASAWVQRDSWQSLGTAARASFLEKVRPDPCGPLLKQFENLF